MNRTLGTDVVGFSEVELVPWGLFAFRDVPPRRSAADFSEALLPAYVWVAGGLSQGNQELIMRTLSLLVLLLPATALAQSGVYDHRGLAGDELGTSLAYVGDLDGDGIADYAAGAPHGPGQQPDAGYVQVFSGRTGVGIHRLEGETTGDLFGWSVAGLGGDIDGDQVHDFIVGAPGYARVYVFSGATGTWLWQWTSGSFGKAGWAVAGPGDADADGVVDYAYSQPGANGGLGLVALVSGATHSPIRTWFGEQAGASFGWALDGAGDLTGDGRADLLVGAPDFDAGSGITFKEKAGKVYLLTGTSSVPESSYTGNAPFLSVGYAVAGGEDLNVDGTPDIAVGVPMVYQLGPPTGRVDVLTGKPSHVVLYQLSGEASGGIG